MKKVLVTGGCGFIGSNFIRFLLDSREDIFITNIDKLTYAGRRENLNDVEGHKRYQFIQGDICDRGLVEDIFQCGFNYVVNFAAESHVDRSIVDSRIFIETNVLGTQVLLDNSVKYGADRYIQISTDEVYGSLALEEGIPFTEENNLSPRNPYSASKAGADLLAGAYFNTYGLPVIITRCSNNYGEYQYPEKLIPKTILYALNDKPIGIYGDGLNVRDWIHVLDHCRAIAAVIENGNPGEIYNIGAENERTNIDIARIILEIMNKPYSLIRYIDDRKGHDRRYSINPGKLKDLGWAPKFSFYGGLSKTIEWYKNNKEYWGV